jgi:hypothetical protein
MSEQGRKPIHAATLSGWVIAAAYGSYSRDEMATLDRVFARALGPWSDWPTVEERLGWVGTALAQARRHRDTHPYLRRARDPSEPPRKPERAREWRWGWLCLRRIYQHLVRLRAHLLSERRRFAALGFELEPAPKRPTRKKARAPGAAGAELFLVLGEPVP